MFYQLSPVSFQAILLCTLLLISLEWGSKVNHVVPTSHLIWGNFSHMALTKTNIFFLNNRRVHSARDTWRLPHQWPWQPRSSPHLKQKRWYYLLKHWTPFHWDSFNLPPLHLQSNAKLCFCFPYNLSNLVHVYIPCVCLTIIIMIMHSLISSLYIIYCNRLSCAFI